MTVMGSQITSQSSLCLIICSNWQQRNIRGLCYCPFVREIHRWAADSLHKGTVSQKMYPFDDVTMKMYKLLWQFLCLSGLYNLHTKALISNDVKMQWASCQIRKIAGAHAPGMPGTFSPSPQVSDPDMHHGTCVTHVPWCMPGSLTSGFLWNRRRGKTFPAFPAHAQPAILRIW